MESRQHNISELTDPASFLSHNAPGNEGAELALDAAVEDWLPEMYDSPVSRRALEQLSDILLSDHHDKWLRDVMSMKQSSAARDAFKNLAFAVRSNLKGEYVSAADFASKARNLFERSHNLAGSLRAQLETVYSLDRRAKPKACFAALLRLRSKVRDRSYTWIEAQARLEDISCRTRTRQEDVIRDREEAYNWITAYTGFEGLGLRALGFRNEEYVSADSRLSLWRRGERGLHSFWRKPLPALRGYSLYLTLAQSAQAAGNREAAMALLRESALLMREHGSTVIRALLLAYLGAWELEANLGTQANATFSEMQEEYQHINSSETVEFRMQSEAVRAEALISAGQPKAGLEQLQQLTQGMTWPFKNLIANIRKPLLPALGDAYLAENHLEDACDNYHQSIAENWQELQSVHDRTQRDNALRETERAWRGMTSVALRLHRLEEALTVWEAFRSSRSAAAVSGLPPIPGCSSTVSSSSPPVPENTTALVYAFLPSGLSGWSVNRYGVTQHWIDERRARVLASHFTELVANSESPMSEISTSAQELCELLIQPFADNLPQDGTLVIDADGVLAGIPWSALEDRPGHPLVERFSFSQAIGLAEVLQHADNTRLEFRKGLIFGPPALQGELLLQYPNLPDASREATKLHRRLAFSTLLEGPEATANAFRHHAKESTLFHFAGHGISYGGFGAMLFAPSSETGLSTQYMTAKQIAGLNLSGMQLVVLSACSSGVGEQSGIVNLDSLTRAFLEAGAHRVIAANWDVDSSHTADLMSVFYDHLIAGEKPAEALRQAELAVRRSEARPHFWASFRVFGIP